jgi:hypothetical protein
VENPDPFHIFLISLLLTSDGSLGVVAHPSLTTKTHPQHRM